MHQSDMMSSGPFETFRIHGISWHVSCHHGGYNNYVLSMETFQLRTSHIIWTDISLHELSRYLVSKYLEHGSSIWKPGMIPIGQKPGSSILELLVYRKEM